MSTGKTHLNEEVTALLDQVHHSSRAGIDRLRNIILSTDETLTENIKWNGPNYSVGGEDRITMKIQPPTRPVQLIFHRGAKKLKQPKDKLITHESKMLTWKEMTEQSSLLKVCRTLKMEKRNWQKLWLNG